MNQAKIKFLSAMGIFGTVGIFVKFIPLGSAAIACFRGVLGVIFLLLLMHLGKKGFDKAAVKRNLPILCISGAAIGINWILLFESYNHTTVATATVCYYLAPLFLLLASPLVGERLTVKKLCCIGVALLGLVFVSGMMEGGLPVLSELAGVGLGVGAALFYASVMVLNKKLSPIPAYEKTVIQLGTAAVVILPYMLIGGITPLLSLNWLGVLLLFVVGIVHTGVAYALYFGSMKELSAQSIAVFSYLDPVIAVLLSALLLKETITLWGILGTVLILGSALYSELPEIRK